MNPQTPQPTPEHKHYCGVCKQWYTDKEVYRPNQYYPIAHASPNCMDSNNGWK